eukprot:scaffold38036_cov50-Attheya_sp.AAC.5
MEHPVPVNGCEVCTPSQPDSQCPTKESSSSSYSNDQWRMKLGLFWRTLFGGQIRALGQTPFQIGSPTIDVGRCTQYDGQGRCRQRMGWRAMPATAPVMAHTCRAKGTAKKKELTRPPMSTSGPYKRE